MFVVFFIFFWCVYLLYLYISSIPRANIKYYYYSSWFVCMCVSALICRLTHWNQYRNHLKFSLKCFVQTLWRNLLTSSSSGVVALFFPRNKLLMLVLNPIATFSLHRERTSGRQRTIRWHRLVNSTDIRITNTNFHVY